MKTVYFPYTAIESSKAETLAAVWGPLTLLQPSPETCATETRSQEAAGWIELLWPTADHGQSLIDLMQAFEQWAVRNTGGDLAALMEQGRTIPFFSSQSSTQIVAELRKRGALPGQFAPSGETRPGILPDQLLLAMAQKFDRQQEELTREIDALGQQERRMMALLKGEDPPEVATPTASRSPSAVRREAMLDQRLKAWARLMTALRERAPGVPEGEDQTLFLTDSPLAAAQVTERFPEARTRLEGHVVTAGELPAGAAASLPPWLAAPLTTSTAAVPGRIPKTSASLDLIEIPTMAIDAFLGRLSGDRQQAFAKPDEGSVSGSCWMAVVSWPEDTPGQIE